MRASAVVAFPVFLFGLLLLGQPPRAWGGGSSEAAGPERGKLLVKEGRIIPASAIRIDSYVSEIDYDYPDPTAEIDVTLHSTGSRRFIWCSCSTSAAP